MSGLSTPTTIPFPRIGPWLLLVPFLLLAAYLVLMLDESTLAQAGSYLHELMHDGRHLLGVPCH